MGRAYAFLLVKLNRFRDNVKVLQERLEHIENLLVVQGARDYLDSSLTQDDRVSCRQEHERRKSAADPPTNSSTVNGRPWAPVVDVTLQDVPAQSWPIPTPTTQDSRIARIFADSRIESIDQSPARQDLPLASNAWVLLQEYLSDFNEAVPLFDKETLIDLYRSVYDAQHESSAVEKAAVHATIVIAHRFRAMSPLGNSSDNELSQAAFEQASAVLPQILMHGPPLLSSQCLVALAVIVHGTSSSEPAFNLLALALRMLVDLFYLCLGDTPSSEEYEQLKRVYWIAFSMEVTLNSIQGRWWPANPDLGIPLPESSSSDKQGQIQVGQDHLEIFSRRSQLAQIQARLIQTVFLFKTSVQHPTQIRAATLSLVHDLKQWRETESLFQTDPDTLSQILHRSDLVHLVILEATYFSTLFALDSFQQGIGPFKGSLATTIEKHSQMKFGGCIRDARRLLRMLQHLPKGNYAYAWLIVEAVVSATFVVLNVLIQNVPATQDLDLALTADAALIISGLLPLDTRGNLTNAAKTVARLRETVTASNIRGRLLVG